MSRRILWLAVVAVAIVAAIVVVVPLFSPGGGVPAGPAGMAGSRAPVIAMRDDTGATVSLAQYRGRIVVLNLWATWCPPCRAEMPDLQRFSDAYADRGVVVVGVNQGESAQRARAFAHSLGIAYPIWLDGRQQYGRAFTALGLPTTVVVDRNGTVVRGYDGALTFDQLRKAVSATVGMR